MNKEIIIALNKTKMIFIFLGALAFLGIGIWFAISPETFSDEGESVGFVKFMGIITALFAGLGIFGIGKKIFDPNPGLIIGKEGIMDNSSAVAVGLIKWEDIIGF